MNFLLLKCVFIQKKRKLEYYEDIDMKMTIRDLVKQKVENSTEAQNLVQKGCDSRITAETGSNKHSSRSHCLLIIELDIKTSENTFISSKLHFIDLAGSERVYKTKSDSQTLEEAKSINLSLHFLEQVVLALSEGSQRHHIPYRNSSLTALLKETLGNNCLTAMIATFSSNLNDISN